MESSNTTEDDLLDPLKIIEDHLLAYSKSRSNEFAKLSEKSQRIHAGFLFYRDNINDNIISQLSYELYCKIIKRIGGTKHASVSSGWMDLGYYLGLDTEEINYISNTKSFTCPIDIALQVYSQNEDATLGKMVEILLKLERLDVIEVMYEPLNKLSDILVTKHKSEEDQGYYSISTKDGSTEIIKPKYIYNNLPEVLQWKRRKVATGDKDKKPPSQDSDSKEIIPEEKKTQFKYSILLTYAEDGLDIARRLSREIMEFNDGEDKVRVICLENEKSHVLTNPELYIRNYFEEVNYVVPIITERYFNAIRSPTQIVGNSMQNLDCQYSRFIYTLMSTHYINGTGCLNKKVRPVLAQDINQDIVTKLCMYPLLLVWTWENEFKKLLGSLFSKQTDNVV